MKFLLTFVLCINASYAFADSAYDLKMYLMEQETWRLINQQNKQSNQNQISQNPVDIYISNLYKENRQKSIQLGAPQTNPIADSSSWVRVVNKKSAAPWFIYKPSIQKITDNEYAYWSLVDISNEPYKAIGVDVMIMSMASKEVINCSNKKYKYQVTINFSGGYGTGGIIKVNTGEFFYDYKDEPIEIKEIVCPKSFMNSLKKNIRF